MATMRQLEIFITVAETGGMRQAADTLGISQASVSRQLRALERTVGGALFLRKRGAKVRISSLGSALLLDARGTLQHHNRLRRKAGQGEAGGPVIFVRSFLLGQLKKRMPMLYDEGLPREAHFTVVADSEDFASLVEARDGSLAVFRTDILPMNNRVVTLLIRSDTGSLYGAPELAALDNEAANVETLDILVPSKSRALEAYTSRLLARAGIGPGKIKPGPQFIELLIEEVLEGRGAAVLFDDTVKELVEQGRLVRLLPVSEPYYFVLLANKSVDPGLLSLVGNAFSKM